MLNYEIEPEILKPYVPFGTELDTWNGKTFVSVVGFLFLNTRVYRIPIPFHRNFEEVNLRFYVRHNSGGEWRRGVVFIKELVPRFAIAATARLLYNENYSALPMGHIIQTEKDTLKRETVVEYRWKFQGIWQVLRAKISGDPQALLEDSEAEFISEHYWGYAVQKNHGCVEYQVEHPRWRVWHVHESLLKCNIAALYGEQYVEALSKNATSAFVAEGSPVLVRQGVRIKAPN